MDRRSSSLVAVFVANAGLMVLQLVAGRLLAPFVGSSIETWTSIIGAFLIGIALGNRVGGRLADQSAGSRLLALSLGLGVLGTLLMIGLPELLQATEIHRLLPLGLRIPVLAAMIGLPPGFALSLPTPIAVKLGTANVGDSGRAAGRAFAAGAGGCLVGNYLTGFVLIPLWPVNTIAFAVAGLMLLAAVLALGVRTPIASASKIEVVPQAEPPVALAFPRAAAIVALTGFATMTIELAAARLLAQVVGVSLYTWTGVIGVTLAGTVAGNWYGGRFAGSRATLAGGLILAAAATVVLLLVFFLGARLEFFDTWPLPARVLGWSFVLFFVPVLLLGLTSPQVVRLAVPDVAHTGRSAGRLYAWSTAGAVLGTFATGYGLIAELGVYRTVLVAAALPVIAALLADNVGKRPPLLYTLSLTLGCVVVGLFALDPEFAGITKETNYFTIRVTDDPTDPAIKHLQLDMLTHSRVKPADPTFLFYRHEQTHLEFLRFVAAEHPEEQRVLVVGGGGYTFPRAARTLVPTSQIDVVEIDPGVTAVAESHLGLDSAWGIRSTPMDGRAFLAERAPQQHYHLITLDAVNDLTVPAHLLTVEFNRVAKRALTPDGVYLLTVIDILDDGKLWRSAIRTLREVFLYTEVLTANEIDKPAEQQVYILYASDQPLNLPNVYAVLARRGVVKQYTRRVPNISELLASGPSPILLTDQFAPVDNLMADVFRRRKTHSPPEEAP